MMCFDEEIRDGFLITEAMKRYWTASLVVLQKFADVCAEYKLKWWADWGTLLGTVRHGGYIPWDDDLDIGMSYEDYMTSRNIPADHEYPLYRRDILNMIEFLGKGGRVCLNCRRSLNTLGGKRILEV